MDRQRPAPPATRSTSTSAPTTRCCARPATSACARSRRRTPSARSSLHLGARRRDARRRARSPTPPARLPAMHAEVRRIVLGQSHELFEAAGFDVRDWQRRDARAAGAARCAGTAAARSAVFIASATRHRRPGADRHRLPDRVEQAARAARPQRRSGAARRGRRRGPELAGRARHALGVSPSAAASSLAALGARRTARCAAIAQRSAPTCACACSRRRSASTSARRSAGGAASSPSTCAATSPSGRPVYFVSSNTHSLANLARRLRAGARERVSARAARRNPSRSLRARRSSARSPTAATSARRNYPLLRAARATLHDDAGARTQQVQAFDAESGHLTAARRPATSTSTPSSSSSRKLDPSALDPRLRVPGLEQLRAERRGHHQHRLPARHGGLPPPLAPRPGRRASCAASTSWARRRRSTAASAT